MTNFEDFFDLDTNFLFNDESTLQTSKLHDSIYYISYEWRN